MRKNLRSYHPAIEQRAFAWEVSDYLILVTGPLAIAALSTAAVLNHIDALYAVASASLTAALLYFYGRKCAALKRSDARVTALLDNAQTCLIQMTATGTIEYVNPAASRLLDCIPAHVNGRHIKTLVPPLFGNGVDIANYLGAPDFHTSIRHSYAQRRDATTFPIELSASMFDLADGRHYFLKFDDISLRNHAEREQALLASIVMSSRDAIISKTMNSIITSWNASAERLFGYSAAEAIGQHIRLIIPPDRIDEEDIIISRLSRGETIDQFRTVRKRKDGRKVDILLTVSPVRNAQGRIIGASKIAREIPTEAKMKSARPILLVEDDPRDLDFFHAAFAKCQLVNPVTVARDGEEALKYIFEGVEGQSREWALVLLDLKLPKVSGLEVLSKIKADPLRRMVPVVVVTGSSEEADLDASSELGANALVTKPMEFSKFTDAVCQVCRFWAEVNEVPRTAAR